jgi:hypothetical protein
MLAVAALGRRKPSRRRALRESSLPLSRDSDSAAPLPRKVSLCMEISGLRVGSRFSRKGGASDSSSGVTPHTESISATRIGE